MSTITPPVRVRAMAQWPESPHLSLSRRQNLSLCPTLVVKMRRPENRYVGLRGERMTSPRFFDSIEMVSIKVEVENHS